MQSCFMCVSLVGGPEGRGLPARYASAARIPRAAAQAPLARNAVSNLAGQECYTARHDGTKRSFEWRSRCGGKRRAIGDWLAPTEGQSACRRSCGRREVVVSYLTTSRTREQPHSSRESTLTNRAMTGMHDTVVHGAITSCPSAVRPELSAQFRHCRRKTPH